MKTHFRNIYSSIVQQFFRSLYPGTSILLLALVVVSCHKVINVNLNAVSPQYVIEGNVSTQPGPYLVTLSQTINFDQLNNAPAISGATVIITDATAGIADTLKENTPGNYVTDAIAGTVGHTYQLYVNIAGHVYTASSTMPQVVALDSLYTLQSAFGNDYSVVPVYNNVTANSQYYYFAEYRNDTETSAIFIRKGGNEVSGTISQSLNGGDGGRLTDGDIVMIDMQCIDSGTYLFYSTLQATNNQNSATPTNPTSNITGGALGYFSAHTSSQKTVVVP